MPVLEDLRRALEHPISIETAHKILRLLKRVVDGHIFQHSGLRATLSILPVLDLEKSGIIESLYGLLLFKLSYEEFGQI